MNGFVSTRKATDVVNLVMSDEYWRWLRLWPASAALPPNQKKAPQSLDRGAFVLEKVRGEFSLIATEVFTHHSSLPI